MSKLCQGERARYGEDEQKDMARRLSKPWRGEAAGRDGDSEQGYGEDQQEAMGEKVEQAMARDRQTDRTF